MPALLNGPIPWWFPWIFVVVGSTTAVLGVVTACRQASRRNSWEATTGKVVAWDHSGGENSSPVVEFTTASGRTVSGVQQGAFDVGFYRTGAQVPVWYDPQNPDRFTAQVNGSHSTWIVMVLVGGLFAVMGYLFSAGPLALG